MIANEKANEKANELVKRFYSESYEFLVINNVSERRLLKVAKQCALICVDEIITEHNLSIIGSESEEYEKERVVFWQQVKKEINNL